MWGLRSPRGKVKEESPVIHSGFLEKKGAKVHNWKNRWFELQQNGNLYYFKKKPKENTRSAMDDVLGSVTLDPKRTSVYIVHQYNQIQQLGLTFKTYETVYEPEEKKKKQSAKQDPFKLDINKVYTVYKRRYRRALSNSSAQSSNAASNSVTTALMSPRASNRRSISLSELEGKFRNLIGHGEELDNYKFMITNESDDGKKLEKKFNAHSEFERTKWISMMEELLVKLHLEGAKQTLGNLQDSSLFASIEEYMDFISLCCSKMDHALYVLNSITRTVEEDEVIALMIISDKFISQNQLSSQQLCSAAIVDELNNSIDQGTLFRRNSVSTKLVTMYFRIHGLAFLQSTLPSLILKIIVEDLNYEIALDKIIESLPADATEEDAKKIQMQNYELLKTLSRTFLMKIMQAALVTCPNELRQVMQIMYEQSNQKWQCGEMCVGALFFLRFLCPAVISPHLFGISQTAPRPNAQRTLLLLTKIIQTVANGASETSKKEAYMTHLNDFIIELQGPTREFLKHLATMKEQRSKESQASLSNLIDDVLALQCLHILHRSLRKTYEAQQFKSNLPEIQDFYQSMLQELRITDKPSTKKLFNGLQSMVGRSRARNVFKASQLPTANNATSAQSEPEKPHEQHAQPTRKCMVFDLTKQDVAIKSILSTVTVSVNQILVDVNSQVLDHSLTIMDTFEPTELDENIDCKATPFKDSFTASIVMENLSPALYAFLSLISSSPWKTIRTVAKDNESLQQLIKKSEELTQDLDASKYNLNELKFCSIICEALNQKKLLGTLSSLYNSTKLPGNITMKKQKMLSILTQMDLLPVELNLKADSTLYANSN